MSVTRGRTLIRLLIPASLTEESNDPKLKTYKVGQVARAAAIFRVDEIIVYRTRKGPDDSRFISTVLRYAEAPQYLRKSLFKMQDELRHIGVIPPLRTPHHALLSDEMEYREGIVAKVGPDGSVWVDIGSDSPSLMKTPERVRVGERVSVRICSRRPVTVQLVNKKDIPLYWGYDVRVMDSLHDALEIEGLRICTSRDGLPVTAEMLSEIREKTRGKVSIAFGSPGKGLDALLIDEGHKLEDYSDYVVNSVPGQGASTVRTEEAVFITMGLFNLIW
jgi:predicted SPOUT superfamily RNA methylase MTH1